MLPRIYVQFRPAGVDPEVFFLALFDPRAHYCILNQRVVELIEDQLVEEIGETSLRTSHGLVHGDDALAARDRAILSFFLYSDVRIGTACRLRVEEFQYDEDGATVRINEKGAKRRTIGLHYVASHNQYSPREFSAISTEYGITPPSTAPAYNYQATLSIS